MEKDGTIHVYAVFYFQVLITAVMSDHNEGKENVGIGLDNIEVFGK